MSQRDTRVYLHSTMSRVPKWKKFFAEGMKHFRRQEMDEAIECFDQVKGDSFLA